MKPYLVKQLRGPDLACLDTTKPTAARQACRPTVARELTKMMESVVDKGTGTTAQIPGVKVAGKTGTAENAPGKPPYAWFVSFAPADVPKSPSPCSSRTAAARRRHGQRSRGADREERDGAPR